MFWSVLWMTLTAVASPVCVATSAELPRGGDDARFGGRSVIVVEKAERRLGVYTDGKLVSVDGVPACWRMALAPGAPPGPKLQEGDLRTPEGWYRTSDKSWSSFYGAIAVHYPNATDAGRGLEAERIGTETRDAIVAALEKGLKPPQATALGGEILIHGGGSSSDWTLGCVALDDDHMDILRDQLPKGMRTWVLLLP